MERSHIEYHRPLHNLNSGNSDSKTSFCSACATSVGKTSESPFLHVTPFNLIPSGQHKGFERIELSVTYPGTFLMTKGFYKKKSAV